MLNGVLAIFNDEISTQRNCDCIINKLVRVRFRTLKQGSLTSYAMQSYDLWYNTAIAKEKNPRQSQNFFSFPWKIFLAFVRWKVSTPFHFAICSPVASHLFFFFPYFAYYAIFLISSSFYSADSFQFFCSNFWFLQSNNKKRLQVFYCFNFNKKRIKSEEKEKEGHSG